MKDRWLREQTLKLSESVARRLWTHDAEIEKSRERWFDLEQRVYELEQHGTEDATMPGPPPTQSEMLAVRLEDAAQREQVVMFRYTKEGQTNWELRQLSPYEVIPVEHGVVVRGWDHQREDIRSFRLDRLEALTTCNGSKYRPPSS